MWGGDPKRIVMYLKSTGFNWEFLGKKGKPEDQEKKEM